MADHESRISVLEVEHNHHKETLGDVVSQLKTLNENVTDINRKLDRNTGFIAGAACVFSLIGAFIGMGGAAVIKRLVP